MLQLILVFSSYRSWIQRYIFSSLGLASCQENKHFLLSATLWSPKTNNCSIVVGYFCHIIVILKGDNLPFLSYENSDFYLPLTSAAQHAKWHNLRAVEKKCASTAYGILIVSHNIPVTNCITFLFIKHLRMLFHMISMCLLNKFTRSLLYNKEKVNKFFWSYVMSVCTVRKSIDVSWSLDLF